MWSELGHAPAMSPELQAADLNRRVGFDLNRAGVDPSLAPRVIHHADDKLGPLMAGVWRRMGTTMNGVVDNQAVLAQAQAQVNARMDQVDARVNHVRASMRGNRGGGLPPLAPSIRPGP